MIKKNTEAVKMAMFCCYSKGLETPFLHKRFVLFAMMFALFEVLISLGCAASKAKAAVKEMGRKNKNFRHSRHVRHELEKFRGYWA